MKRVRPLCAAAILVVLACVPVYGFDELRLLITEFAPYTYEGNGAVRGTGAQALQKVLSLSGVPYSSVVVSSLETAVSETRAGSAAGFFPAADRPTGNFAVFGPLLIHRGLVPVRQHLQPRKASFTPYAGGHPAATAVHTG
jgi:hypothetical protein